MDRPAKETLNGHTAAHVPQVFKQLFPDLSVHAWVVRSVEELFNVHGVLSSRSRVGFILSSFSGEVNCVEGQRPRRPLVLHCCVAECAS